MNTNIEFCVLLIHCWLKSILKQISALYVGLKAFSIYLAVFMLGSFV